MARMIGAVPGGVMMVAVVGRGIIIITGPPCQSRSGNLWVSGWVGGGVPIWCPKSAQDSRQRERVCCSARVSIPIYMNTSTTLPTGTCHSKGLIHSTKYRECKSSGLLLNLNFCYVYRLCDHVSISPSSTPRPLLLLLPLFYKETWIRL